MGAPVRIRDVAEASAGGMIVPDPFLTGSYSSMMSPSASSFTARLLTSITSRPDR